MTALSRSQAAGWPDLPGHRVTFGADQPMPLDCGVEFGPFTIAYQTYGTLEPRARRTPSCSATP